MYFTKYVFLCRWLVTADINVLQISWPLRVIQYTQIQTDICISLDIDYAEKRFKWKDEVSIGPTYIGCTVLGGNIPSCLKIYNGPIRNKFTRQIFVLTLLNKINMTKAVVLFLRRNRRLLPSNYVLLLYTLCISRMMKHWIKFRSFYILPGDPRERLLPRDLEFNSCM